MTRRAKLLLTAVALATGTTAQAQSARTVLPIPPARLPTRAWALR